MDLWNTYYYLPYEQAFTGPKSIALPGPNGDTIAMVKDSFFQDFCVEGSGVLEDGRTVNYYGHGGGSDPVCNYGHTQARYHVVGCATGSGGRCVVPMRSLAVDPSVIPMGSRVFIREYAGLVIPRLGGAGGFTHDGWFVAADTGGAIHQNHIDVYAGPRELMRYMERVVPTRSSLHATIYPAGTATRSSSGGVVPALALALLGGVGAWYLHRIGKL